MRKLDLGPELVDRYVAGESELSLAKTYGISRSVIRKRLLEAGVTPRSYSDANLLRASKLTPEERKAQAQAAHDSWRGSKMSTELLVLKAKTKQERGTNISPSEQLLACWLKKRGVVAVPQQALGIYNLDLGVEPVAIEIFGGGWHASGKHAEIHQRRCEYILSLGWSLVIVWVDKYRYPLSENLADYIANLVHKVRADKNNQGKWWAVRGDGREVEALTLDDLLRVPGITNQRRQRRNREG